MCSLSDASILSLGSHKKCRGKQQITPIWAVLNILPCNA